MLPRFTPWIVSSCLRDTPWRCRPKVKTFIDAARKVRVQHIVHLGVFGHWDYTDPHIAWPQLVKTYIEASGIAWTHIHPNMFMERIPKFLKGPDQPLS